MNRYEKKIIVYSERIRRKVSKKFKKPKRKNYPATIVCAYLDNDNEINKNGTPPKNIAPNLLKKLQALGGIGTQTNCGNTIGRCAEVRSSNLILRKYKTIQPSNINFTNAYRPRTQQIVPMCLNCKRTF